MQKQVNIQMGKDTHRRLKMLAADLELPIGTTLLFLLDQYRPIDIQETIKMMEQAVNEE